MTGLLIALLISRIFDSSSLEASRTWADTIASLRICDTHDSERAQEVCKIV